MTQKNYTVIKINYKGWGIFPDEESRKNYLTASSIASKIKNKVNGEQSIFTVFGIINDIKTEMPKNKVVEIINEMEIPDIVKINVKTGKELMQEKINKLRKEIDRLEKELKLMED